MTEVISEISTETAVEETATEQQYISPNSYDPSGNTELDEVRARLEASSIDPKHEAAIRAAAGKKHFPLELQFECADMNKVVTFTLGELAATATHEKAVQYIYPDRVSHVLYGPHGIAKGNKLSNDIQVCWRRNEYTGELEATPCVTSGRHRLTAIILLLQHLGINWEKQRIMVSTKVVSTDAEFAQLIFDNNDSRKMKVAEKRNHKLGAIGINTADEDSFYTDPQNSVRRAKATVCPQAFGAAARFCAVDRPQAFQDKLYQYAAGAFAKVRDVSKENKAAVHAMIQMPKGTDDEVLKLKNAAQFVADNFLTSINKGKELFPLAYECHSAPKAMSILLAEHLGLEVPTFEAK